MQFLMINDNLVVAYCWTCTCRPKEEKCTWK